MSSSKVAPSAVKVGDHIKATLLDDRSVTYSGRVIGIANYTVAKSMGSDIAAKHEDIKASITAATGEEIDDVLDQKFLIVDIGDVMPIVIAFQWVTENSVELVEPGAIYLIKLIDSSKERAEEAVSILRSNGITCKLNITY